MIYYLCIGSDTSSSTLCDSAEVIYENRLVGADKNMKVTADKEINFAAEEKNKIAADRDLNVEAGSSSRKIATELNLKEKTFL